jgi:amidohydrolase
MNKQELKAKVCKIIDAHRTEILAIGDSIFKEPELGFKEIKTAAKVKKLFTSLGYNPVDHQAITGVIATVKGKEHKLKVAVMGEMDALHIPDGTDADKKTGASHMCGHNCQIASLAGVAYALQDKDIMSALSGDVELMAVPAEEFIDIEYRKKMRDEGKITMFGGKQEFILKGLFDDIDMMIMQHNFSTEGDHLSTIKANCGGKSNGFITKQVIYTGKAAHAGGAPYKGANALSAAKIGLVAIDAQRETFKDEDHIRVHGIITKGGDAVNVVPSDVRLDLNVRGGSVEAILDASQKVNRALKAGGYAMGVKTDIVDIPSYLPLPDYPLLRKVMYDNLVELLGSDKVLLNRAAGGGATDAADVAHFMPVLHAYIGGAAGNQHGNTYKIMDKELAYIVAAKALAMTLIDLLADEATIGLEIKKAYKPLLTKKEYEEKWVKMEERKL